MRVPSISAIAVALLLGSPLAAVAAPIVHQSQGAFLAAISGAETDTFDDIGTGMLANPLARSTATYDYQAWAEAGLWGIADGTGRWLSNYGSEVPLVLSAFSTSVSGVGGYFFTTNMPGASVLGDIEATVVDSDGNSTIHTIVGSSPSTFTGFSVAQGYIASLTLRALQPQNVTEETSVWVTLDDLALGATREAIVALSLPAPTEAPAPAPMVLLGLGLVGLAAARRHRGTA